MFFFFLNCKDFILNVAVFSLSMYKILKNHLSFCCKALTKFMTKSVCFEIAVKIGRISRSTIIL